eukprot:CAMPEP_0197492526 /NCGR_PEP_ID=MMETSP1311-20131121/10283_1 /TAXON_ID=464262 /ORGANISM="Genus nov. species nov., Strain RCC856" /LENGTH=63 /DNA_ID=CAMNT_0043037473 /DNA_START=11 /DNA_END=199 /DNA_ORIENTATION=+
MRSVPLHDLRRVDDEGWLSVALGHQFPEHPEVEVLGASQVAQDGRGCGVSLPGLAAEEGLLHL